MSVSTWKAQFIKGKEIASILFRLFYLDLITGHYLYSDTHNPLFHFKLNLDFEKYIFFCSLIRAL